MRRFLRRRRPRATQPLVPIGYGAGLVVERARRPWSMHRGGNMRIRQMGLVLVLVLAAACGGSKKEDTTAAGGGGAAAEDKRSLYDRLGGLDAITGVVEDFVNTAAT